MNKLLAVAMTALLVLAGCIDAEDAVDQIDDVVDMIVPGCNNPDAYNYNESAENDLACLGQDVLTESLTSFVLLMENGPQIGDTAGMTQHSEFTDSGMDGEDMDMDMTMSVMTSPNGSVMHSSISAGTMMEFEQTWWAFPGAENTTDLYVDYNGEVFMMSSAMSYSETMEAWLGDDEDMDDGMDDMDDGMDDMDEMYYAFYCSNDGEDYAESMGGILCPEGPGEVPTCPDGMPCTCIDVDESCTDGDDDWGYLSDEPSDEMGDVEAPEIDFSLYDWNSTNFSMTVDLTNPESMFDFSADVTVEGVTHEIDIAVNEMFEVRAMTVHVEEYDETVTMTLHTEAEIADMLADGMVEGPAMEALPFTLEMAYMDDDMDHGDDEDWETMATDADGNPLFVTVLDCITLVDQAMLANSTFQDVVDSAMLDTSMCGNETDAYTFTTNESHVVPTGVMLVDGDEEVGLMLSSDTITMYGLMFEGMPVNETKCGEEQGTWNANDSTCVLDVMTITQQDSGAIEADGDMVQYLVNETAGVVVFMAPHDMYVCDNGDRVDADYYNDGSEDCTDGSDEPEDSTTTPVGQFVDAYQCTPFVDASLITENQTIFEAHEYFHAAVEDSTVDDSLCSTLWDGSEHTFTNSTVTVPTSLVYADMDTLDAVEMAHDGMNLTITIPGWTSMGANASDCEAMGGMHDSTTDTCSVMFTIVNADGGAVEVLSNENETTLLRYVYNASSMQGYFIEVVEMYECADGAIIPEHWYDDMHADCMDGSDEPNMDTTSPEYVGWDFMSIEDDDWNTIGFEVMFYDNAEMVDGVDFELVDESDGSVLLTWTLALTEFETNADGELVHDITVDDLVNDHTLGDGCYSIYAEIEYNNGTEMFGQFFCVGDNHGTDGDSSGLWTVEANEDMFAFAGDVADYSIVLADCSEEYDEDADDYVEVCGDDVVSVVISTVMHTSEEAAEAAIMNGAAIVFLDTDGSGTITAGDMIGVPGDGGTEDDWNTVRLHSTSADAYSDENPTLPGFTGVFATLALLGAAFIRRN